MTGPGRAVVWDFDGTLAERPGLWSGCLLEILDEEDPGHGLLRQDIAAQLRDGFPWHAPERAHPHLCEPETWWGEVGGLLAGACERLGYPPDVARRLAARTRVRYVDGTVGWRLLPGAETALRRLRDAGCRQVILSNHVPELAGLVGRLGLAAYFDAVVTSALTGFEKPHPSAYAAAMGVLGGVAEVWMVGDSQEADYHGPERHGIRGVLLWPGGDPCPVERHVRDLTSAAEIILNDPFQVR